MQAKSCGIAEVTVKEVSCLVRFTDPGSGMLSLLVGMASFFSRNNDGSRGGELVVRSARATPSWDGRTARLELECLEPEDAGVYTCSAENEAGRARCSAELKVLASDDPSDEDRRPPVFPRGLPDHVHLTEGEPAELQVLLRGTPAMDVVWTKDGVEVPDCNDFRYVDHGEGRLGLRIADVFPEDEGVYRCEAFNDHGDCYTECHVDVRGSSSGGGGVAPQFVKEPLPVLAPVGGRASFCLRAHRVLSPEEVCWRVAGVPASSCSRFKVETRLDESVLTVEPVQAEDAGPVTCDMGDARCRAELGVVDVDQEVNGATPRPESPALLLRGPRDTTALVGDRVVLRAAYSGSPEPTVRWLRAGRELAASERVQLHSQDGVACLSLDNITADDSGKYVVSVENCLGADCHFASVAVEGPPDPPAGRPSVTSCGQGSAVVTWSSPPYDGGCMLTGYSVEMSKASADPQWTVVADKCNSLSHTVVGLQADEKNLFRIRAHNVHGCSDASTESEPFVLGEVEESYGPSFEAREVLLEAGEKFRRLYEVLEELGKGRYGVVHKVCELASGRKFAAKFVRCVKVADRGKVHEEIGIMNMLRHPKLLQLRAAFDTPRDIVMVTEYISGGELFERVVADDFTLTEKDCILFMRQICEGVDYMHQNYVVHLDLKPENIMCHTRTSHQIKLIDFGLAKKLDPDIPVRVMFGTPEFIPPEIINYEPIGLESDMWSVGVICYVLLSGLSPFMGDNDAQTFNNITKADYDFEDEAFDAISQDSKDFISSLLVKRKEKRLTASECLQHKWLTQHHDSMSCVKLSTDKLKTFIIRRKWQKTGNAIRALGRLATLSAATRRNSVANSAPGSPRPSLSGGAMSRMSSLGEEELDDSAFANNANHAGNGCDVARSVRMRVCSERSDSGISDCSSIATPQSHLPCCQCHARHHLRHDLSISEELETVVEKIADVCPDGSARSSPGSCARKETVSRDRICKDVPTDRLAHPTTNGTASTNQSSRSFSPAVECCAKTEGLRRRSPDPDTPAPTNRRSETSLDDGQQDLTCEQNKTTLSNSCRRNVPKNLPLVANKVLETKHVLFSSAQDKSPTRKSPVSTSNEHSANYQKAMAFWKR